MDQRVITMQQLLKMTGYRIGHIAKLHVYSEVSFPFDYRGPDDNGTRDIELIAQRAGELLGQRPQQPFFLTVCYSDPHEPYFTQVKGYPQPPYGPTKVPPFPWIGTADTPDLQERMAGMYNGIARMDAGVGMLLNKLTQLGLYKNTIVIFTGDNGPYFPRAKITCYEAGLRVPLIVRYPGQISANMVNNSLISTVDIMPTVLRAAGVSVPQNLAGRSLMQLFRGNTIGWRGVLCAEYTSTRAKALDQAAQFEAHATSTSSTFCQSGCGIGSQKNFMILSQTDMSSIILLEYPSIKSARNSYVGNS